jgi:plastocyanin
MRAIAVLVMVLVCIAFTCGCTGQTPAQKTTPPATPVTVPVTTPVSNGQTRFVSLEASSYNPEQLYIRTGTTVTWVNGEDRMTRRVVHMPTEVTGKILFQSEALSPGESFSYTFNTPGRYVYADPQHGGGRSPFVEVTD